MMRMELQEPGIQIFHGLAQMVYGRVCRRVARLRQAHVQRFTTAHGLIMIFFMACRDDWWLRQLVRTDPDRRAGHGSRA